MEWVLSMDRTILLYIQQHIRTEPLTVFFKWITVLGNSGWFWITLSLLFLISKKTRMVGAGALLAMAIGALCTNLLLKNMIQRARPYETFSQIIPLIKKPWDSSFPSGHATVSFAAASGYFFTGAIKIGTAALILAVMIGCSRMYLGVHYPTDVAVGTIVGILSGFTAGKILIKNGDQKYGKAVS